MADKPVEMIKRNGVYVAAQSRGSGNTRIASSVQRKGSLSRPLNPVQEIEKIISGIVVAFFRGIRREMFK